MSESRNIYQRINEVMKAIDYVQKDSDIDIPGGGKYMAVSHDQVTALARKEFVKNGIVVEPEQKKGTFVIKRDVSANVKMHLYSGDYKIHFVNIDNPEDRATVKITAHANDNGDKAPGKAVSYATKYAILKILSLETGEDDESRMADPYSPEQLAEYHELIESERAYEFYTFMQTLSPDTAAALHNTFPDGKKTQGKKAARELEVKGKDVFENTVDTVKQRLADQDISVIEITDEMGPLEKRLLMKRLTQFEIGQIRKIKEASL